MWGSHRFALFSMRDPGVAVETYQIRRAKFPMEAHEFAQKENSHTRHPADVPTMSVSYRARYANMNI
jgi:hypothetical protein